MPHVITLGIDLPRHTYIQWNRKESLWHKFDWLQLLTLVIKAYNLNPGPEEPICGTQVKLDRLDHRDCVHSIPRVRQLVLVAHRMDRHSWGKKHNVGSGSWINTYVIPPWLHTLIAQHEREMGASYIGRGGKEETYRCKSLLHETPQSSVDSIHVDSLRATTRQS